MKMKYEARMNHEIGDFECLNTRTRTKSDCTYKGACVKCPKNNPERKA